jgi:hypothetical protein
VEKRAHASWSPRCCSCGTLAVVWLSRVLLALRVGMLMLSSHFSSGTRVSDSRVILFSSALLDLPLLSLSCSSLFSSLSRSLRILFFSFSFSFSLSSSYPVPLFLLFAFFSLSLSHTSSSTLCGLTLSSRLQWVVCSVVAERLSVFSSCVCGWVEFASVVSGSPGSSSCDSRLVF